MSLIRQITMHPAVQQALRYGTTDPALKALTAFGRDADPEHRRLRTALDAGTLPADLHAMVAARLAAQGVR